MAQHSPYRGLAGLLSLVFCSLLYAADTYPVKPVNLIVGFPPGGGADIVARVIGQKLSDTWGQPLVVVNRPGADSVIAYESASQAAPDGYTLLLVTTEFAINPSMYPLRYDTLKDFAPLTEAAYAPYILVTHPSVPARSAAELISLAKAKPGQLSFAVSGTGVYLAAEFFRTLSHINLLKVPYKGGPQAVADVIAGQVSIMFPSMPTGYPHVKSGKLRALAVTSAQRSRFAPELPTIAESGLAGYEAIQWWGFVGRAGTPKEILNKASVDISKIVSMLEIRERLATQNAEARSGTADQFGAYIRVEMAKWAKVVKDSGAKID